MQHVVISSSAKRVWIVAGQIWLLSTLAVGVIVRSDALVQQAPLGAWELVAFLVLPLGLTLGWLAYIWATRRKRARRLMADDAGITIERRGGQSDHFQWSDIRAVRFNSMEEEMMVLVTASGSVPVYGHGFAAEDWSTWLQCVLDCVNEDVTYADMHHEFELRLSSWLDRASVCFAIVGGLATAALAIWNPNNAAFLILLVGTLAVLCYLGTQSDCGEGRVPIAKAIGFWSSKLLAFVPLTLIGIMLLRLPGFGPPPAANPVVFALSNAMFFGGMAVALVVRNGFSPARYVAQQIGTVYRWLFVAALCTCAVGFALKIWNER